MSIDATRWAWTQQITPSQKIVLLSLADRAGEDGYCYPSMARLIVIAEDNTYFLKMGAL